MVNVTDRRTGISSKQPLDLEAWLERLAAGRSAKEMATLQRACGFAQEVLQGHPDPATELQHGLAVANILDGLGLDAASLAAAVLHELVLQGWTDREAIAAAVGPAEAGLVAGLVRLDGAEVLDGLSSPAKQSAGQAEALRKMVLAMAEDVRVVLVKLADQVQHMRALGTQPAAEQQRLARQARDIFAPLANRLGIWQLKWELEDLALRYLDPDTYRQIAGLLKERRVDRERYIQDFTDFLARELSDAGIQAEVVGRPKHIYSIWRKMERKDLSYERIRDVRAVRVLVHEVHDCYAVLGVVHALWDYIPTEFDDYIATPKDNDYRSIHTAVIGPEGKVVEVQIRTYDMHHHAELGIAAHWRYKEGAAAEPVFEHKVALLRQLLEWKADVAQVPESERRLLEDRVYCLTPRGSIVDLPQGATPLDFAYHIHSDLGHRCRGAKVNGVIVTLTSKLKTGDRVEILTTKQGAPSRDWLNPNLGYLHSRRARNKVQHWFNQQHYGEHVAAGRHALERELTRLQRTDVNFQALADGAGYTRVEDLLAAIGRGSVRLSQIAQGLKPLAVPASAERDLPPSPPSVLRQPDGGVQIQGVGELLSHLAGCCRPVPGDAIVGFITRGRGITVHQQTCPNLTHYQDTAPERLVEVEWAVGEGQRYPVNVHILASDEPGVLRDITSVLANENRRLVAAHTHTGGRQHMAKMQLTLEVEDIEELSRVMDKIRQLPAVVEVQREGH